VALAAVGCGGSSVSIGAPKKEVINLGGIPSANGVTPAAVTVPPAGGATTSTTINSQTVNVLIPSGLDALQFPGGVLPANTLITVMNGGQPLIKGNFGKGGPVSIQSPAPGMGGPAGPIVVNSGIAVDGSGSFTNNIALPMGLQLTSYVLTFPHVSIPVTSHASSNSMAPATKTSNDVNVNINIKNVKVQGGCGNKQSGRFPQVDTGFTDVPTSIDGALPGNGAPLKGSSVKLTWANADNDGKMVTVKLSWPGVSIQQKQTISGGVVNFQSLGNGNEVIPATGIDVFEVDISPR